VTRDPADTDFPPESELCSWWGKLTKADVKRIAGRKDELIGMLQEKYCYTRAAATQEVDRRFQEFKKDRAVREATPQTRPDETLPTTALELESLAFFESGTSIPPKAERRYNTRFPQQTTRCVFAELTARNRFYKKRDATYQLSICYYYSEGSHRREERRDWVVKSDWDRPSYLFGWGAAEPGSGRQGTLQVQIKVNGVKFAEGAFTIEEESTPTSSRPRESVTSERIDENFLREAIHSWWKKFTEADVMRIAGQKEQLIRVLQEKYCLIREAAGREIDRRFQEYREQRRPDRPPPKPRQSFRYVFGLISRPYRIIVTL
jgi:hypothetical protein